MLELPQAQMLEFSRKIELVRAEGVYISDDVERSRCYDEGTRGRCIESWFIESIEDIQER